MYTSYLLLIITCVLYGLSGIVSEWEEFGAKLANMIVIIAIIVLTLITGEDGFFLPRSNIWWINFVIPIPAIYIGACISATIDNDDWHDVFGILGIIGLIATIITTCCGV